MTPNFAAVKTLSNSDLAAFERELTRYVAERPEHHAGLCRWLHHAHYAGTFEVQVYELISGIIGYSRGYVDDAPGPTPKRVAFAAQFLNEVKAEIEARAQKPAKKGYTIDLKKASLQRIFEFGLRHGRTQGKQSKAGGVCAMRGADGMACIVGAMIDDTLAAKCDAVVAAVVEQRICSDEPGYVPSAPRIHYPEWAELLGKNEKKAELLRKMQTAHDDSCRDFLPEFEGRMEAIAANFGLTYKAPGTTLRA